MILRDHRGPARADVRRYYGIPLDGAREAGVPLSELADMVAHLPPEAAVWRALDPDWRWDIHAQLTAQVIDEVRALTWLLERLKTKSKRKAPEPFPRPGVTPPEDVSVYGGRSSALPMDEMAAWLGWPSP